jgi:hypothetical protein
MSPQTIVDSQTILPTLLDSLASLRHQQGCKPDAQAHPARSRALKKAQHREEEGMLLSHNGIRFLMDELLEAVQNMDPQVNWKWENLITWYEEYFCTFLQHHHDAEANICFPWIRTKLARIRLPADFQEHHPAPTHALSMIGELLKTGRGASPSQKTGIHLQLCQVLEEMVEKMHDHLAEQEEIVPPSIKKAGFTNAELNAMTMKIIQSVPFDNNKLVLPSMVHALRMSEGPEKAAAFVQNLPKPDRFLYSSSWDADFNGRHLGLIRSVNRDEVINPQASK